MVSARTLVNDLYTVLTHADIPKSAVEHLVENESRLIRGAYEDGHGGGCVMTLLTETLESDLQIRSKADLVRFFGRAQGKPGQAAFVSAVESDEYQCAKWVVRAWDHQVCDELRARYGVDALRPLPKWLVLAVARKVIAEAQHRQEKAPQAAATSAAQAHPSEWLVPASAG